MNQVIDPPEDETLDAIPVALGTGTHCGDRRSRGSASVSSWGSGSGWSGPSSSIPSGSVRGRVLRERRQRRAVQLAARRVQGRDADDSDPAPAAGRGRHHRDRREPARLRLRVLRDPRTAVAGGARELHHRPQHRGGLAHRAGRRGDRVTDRPAAVQRRRGEGLRVPQGQGVLPQHAVPRVRSALHRPGAW